MLCFSFALMPMTSYWGNAERMAVALDSLRSSLFATMRTGMPRASRLPSIVMFTWLMGSFVASRMTRTASILSSHLMDSMTPFVASFARSLASGRFMPPLRKSSKSIFVAMPGVSTTLNVIFLPLFSIMTFSFIWISRVSWAIPETVLSSSPSQSMHMVFARVLLPEFGGP